MSPKLCPICLLTGVRTPLDARGVCPVQATEAKRVSEARRASIRAVLADKDEKAGF